MKRKTNLFYTTGEDTNFITFSNYTESLTGNFLSTDTKLYPSAFICMYVPALNETTKTEFITKYMAGYYENKLAIVRDYCIAKNINIEENVCPLDYLLTAIGKFDSSYKINFINTVTEQDYNGVFSDTICVINGNNKAVNTTITGSGKTLEFDDFSDYYDGNVLYGWKNAAGEFIGPSLYSAVTPIYDGGKYTLGSTHKYINITEINGEIKFNIVIPLYDVININTEIAEIVTDTLTQIDLSNNGYTKFVPLGIWFSNNCEPIILKRDTATNYMPSWSLMLSSQFKPFPNSSKLTNDVSGISTGESYNTFAQVLIRQNEITDNIIKLTQIVQNLSNRLNNIQSQLNASNSHDVITNIQNRLTEIENILK